LRQILGRKYDKGLCVPAIGTAGGIFLTWKRSLFREEGSSIKENVASVCLAVKLNGQKLKIIGYTVYGPSSGPDRGRFFSTNSRRKE
jgi:hypothetical protein